jgi:hypothetical protein
MALAKLGNYPEATKWWNEFLEVRDKLKRNFTDSVVFE